MDISRIAVAPGDRAVLPVGSGSGLGTCTHIGLRGSAAPTDASGWTWNAVLEEQSVSIYATSVTFNRTGHNFAIGYSDGTITMHPTMNITPHGEHQHRRGTGQGHAHAERREPHRGDERGHGAADALL